MASKDTFMVTFPSYTCAWPKSHYLRVCRRYYLGFLSEALRSESPGSRLAAGLGPEPRSDCKSGGCSTTLRCHLTRLVSRVITDSKVPSVGPYS